MVSSHLHDLYPYIGATYRRTGPPCADVTGLPSISYATITSLRRACDMVRLSVYVPSKLMNLTPPAPARTPARSSRWLSRTPRHGTSITRQPVTHWKSRVNAVGGNARNSSYVSVNGRSTWPRTCSRYFARSRCGNEPVTV